VEGREGILRRGEDVSGGRDEGEPERLEGPGEQEAPTRTKPPGEQKGVRLFRGDEAAEAPMRGREVSQGSARAERGRETFLRSPGRRKALKGEAQERRGLKEASTGRGIGRRAERVAKPWERDFSEARHVSGTLGENPGCLWEG
jgi:hypothetical protein